MRPYLLLTRPRREARLCAQALQRLGIECLRMPLQSTRRAPGLDTLSADLRFAAGAIQVFVSRAAVSAALRSAQSSVVAAAARIAVGRATAAALRAQGLPVLSAPSDAEDSDGVLGLPLLQSLAGTKVAIWAAPGGRDHIASVLAQRGSVVRVIPIYQRVPVRARPPALRKLGRHAQQVILSATSATLLDRLQQSLLRAGLWSLHTRPLIVASARIASHARSLGFVDVHLARGASATALGEVALRLVHA